MQGKLLTNPEAKRLLHLLKKAAPHLLFQYRDRARHTAYQNARGPRIWETLRSKPKPLADGPSQTAPLKPKTAPDNDFSAQTKYTKTGKAIPSFVERGKDCKLTDKPKHKP
jgi:carbonic anhydrase